MNAILQLEERVRSPTDERQTLNMVSRKNDKGNSSSSVQLIPVEE